MFRKGFIIAAVLAGALPAAAQPPRGPRAFPGVVSTDTDRLVDVEISAGGGYDATLATEALPSQLGPVPASMFGDLTTGLRYVRRGPKLALTAGGGNSVRRYTALGPDPIFTQDVAISSTIRFSDRAELRTEQSVSRQPYMMFASVLETGAPGHTFLQQTRSVSARAGDPGLIGRATADFAAKVGRTGELDVTYQYRTSDFPDRSLDVMSQVAGAGIKRGLSRYSALDLGYRFERGSYGADGRVAWIHHINTGIDYGRPLPGFRQTTIELATGAAIADAGGGPVTRITGHARLARRFKTTWSADAAYRRDVGFMHAFAAPVASDALTAGMDGYLADRLQVRLAATYTNGGIGVSSSGGGFDLYDGTATLKLAVSTKVAVALEGFYRRYVFAAGAALPPGWSRRFECPGIRLGIVSWVPLFERTRRSDAAR